MPTQSAVAGVDIGGTKISAVVCDAEGTVLASGVVPAPARQGGAAMTAAAAGLVRALEESSGRRVLAVGAGAAGVIDQATGTVRAASSSFSGWAGYPLGAALTSALGIPAVIENDVNAFLLGELRWGAARGADGVVGIALGTGVGGAIAQEGRIYSGPRGAAGEIGHTPGYGEHVCTCGQTGHLETLASGRSIEARYAERSGRRGVGAVEVARLARGGDADAQAVFDAAGRALALAIVTAATLLDVSLAVVGGGVRGAWDLIEPSLDATLADNEPVSGYPLVVRPATLGGDAVAVGAAALAWPLVERRSDPGVAERATA